MKIGLVPNWRDAHRWLTMRAAALLAILAAVSVALPTLADDLPKSTYHWIVFGFAVTIGIGRLINQTPGSTGIGAQPGPPDKIDPPNP